ncbi:hypothetical protein [Paenibacillus sp. y28]|uniref:hypothetical protein n=1 Tax=Paenibacillus sp. y28 TaxID=3129110 RepID=UPI0030191B95
MKKKWVMLGSVVGISSVVMAATGFSALASTSGYEAYKSALKQTKAVQNVTVQAGASLQDNGLELVRASGNVRIAADNQAASGTAEISANGASQSVSFFKQADQTVVKPGAEETYYVKQWDKAKQGMNSAHKDDPEVSAQVETVIDALLGNLKDYVAVEDNADGTKQISLQLDNTQLPAVVNAIAPIAIKHATRERPMKQQGSGAEELPFQKNWIQAAAPELTQDIKIENVHLKATVNAANYIEHQEAEVTVSGKDDSGEAHQLTLHVAADLSEFNSTTPETIDLTGKNVQEIKKERRGLRHTAEAGAE